MLIYRRILFTYTKRAKEINTSGRLGGVKNDWGNGNLLIYRRILFTYTKRAKEINTSGRLGGVKNDWGNGTRPDPLFSTGAYTASDKRPVEKIAVWPRETNITLHYTLHYITFTPIHDPHKQKTGYECLHYVIIIKLILYHYARALYAEIIDTQYMI